MPQFDISAVGVLTLVMGAFGFFVKATIKSAISDLKDDLAKSYMATTEIQLRFAALQQRVAALENHIFNSGNHHKGHDAS